jgi:hypothetical protein
MTDLNASPTGWRPATESWEESVLSWHEQIEVAFRRRDETGERSGPALGEEADRRLIPVLGSALAARAEREVSP